MEHELPERLPPEAVVLRGFCHRGGEQGISWTPQRKFGQAFAERWSLASTTEELFMVRAVVPRDLIVACFVREAHEGCEVIIPTPVSAFLISEPGVDEDDVDDRA